MITETTKSYLSSTQTYDFGRLKRFGVRWMHNGARLTTQRRYEEDCRRHEQHGRRVQLLPGHVFTREPRWLALIDMREDDIKVLR